LKMQFHTSNYEWGTALLSTTSLLSFNLTPFMPKYNRKYLWNSILFF
jgi:hypothetical protein